MFDDVETEFYVTPCKSKTIYHLFDGNDGYIGSVDREIYFSQQLHQERIKIVYKLRYNVVRNFSISEKRMINNYFHNLVNTLTHDIQTLYTDNIEERLELPFMVNLIHIKVAD